MNWSCKYLGLSYKDYDCAEFVQYALKKDFDIDFRFPTPGKNAKLRYEAIRESMNNFIEASPADIPEDGDCILMSGDRRFNHIGLLAIHKGVKYCVHSMALFGAVVRHRVSDLELHSLKVEGIYKWQK